MIPDIIFKFAFLIIGLLLFAMGFKVYSQKKLIQDIPLSKIRSLAIGLVEICGNVVSSKDKILKGPFTKKDCVYYRYTIEEYRKERKRSRWVKIRTGEDSVLFFLKDDTSSILVDPKEAQVEVSHNFQIESGIGKEPPENIKEFLEASNISYKSLFFNRALRYTEYFIEPGGKLYILGTAGDNPYVEETMGKGAEDIMIQKGKIQKFYYISDKPEVEVVKNLGTQSIIFIVIGALFTVIGVATIIL